VALHCPLGQMQALGGGAIGQTLGDQFRNFEFASTQTARRSPGRDGALGELDRLPYGQLTSSRPGLFGCGFAMSETTLLRVCSSCSSQKPGKRTPKRSPISVAPPARAIARPRHARPAWRHRVIAWRRRASLATQALPLTTPPGRSRIVYICPACEQRYLGEQYCPDCETFCRRVGSGGPCPH
jgi:hypothetical protein